MFIFFEFSLTGLAIKFLLSEFRLELCQLILIDRALDTLIPVIVQQIEELGVLKVLRGGISQVLYWWLYRQFALFAFGLH